MKFAFLLGRLMFGGFFLQAGIHHIQERESMAQYAATKNVPMPDLAVTATGVALTMGGASILLGVKPKVGRWQSPAFWPAFRPSCTTSGRPKIPISGRMT